MAANGVNGVNGVHGVNGVNGHHPSVYGPANGIKPKKKLILNAFVEMCMCPASIGAVVAFASCSMLEEKAPNLATNWFMFSTSAPITVHHAMN